MGFDAGKVADLAKQIQEAEKKVKELTELTRIAQLNQRSAENTLSNLYIEFTRASAPKLDKCTYEHFSSGR